jgi:hypothetical protein
MCASAASSSSDAEFSERRPSVLIPASGVADVVSRMSGGRLFRILGQRADESPQRDATDAMQNKFAAGFPQQARTSYTMRTLRTKTFGGSVGFECTQLE